MKSQKEKATEFRNMHQSGDILVLANAWDVPSARIFQEAGFLAIGTTSAGIALSLGYPDGQKISRDEMLQVVARITRSVSIPVTADVEAGYGESAADVAETTKRVISAGAIGLNIEDSTKKPENPLYDVNAQAQKIMMIRKVAGSLDVPLVINARTDALLHGPSDNSSRLKEAIRRGNEYGKAGADCFFPVGAIDAKTISEIVAKVGSPVNILATNNVPTIPELKRLGVRRVSVGSGPARATLGLVKRIANELRQKGTYEALLNGAPTLAEANKLVAQGEG
jgi:2-methylisocitrate lyase-like PEP mutase family enzyme